MLVPTYRRTESLERCLEGLRAQRRAADEVIVITQRGDEASRLLLEGWRDWDVLRVVEASGGGVVRQLNLGLETCTGDLIAFTDDDSVPRPDWLERMEAHFVASPDLGGLGGRDWVFEHGALLTGSGFPVGTIQWFGRITGNHHIGARAQDNVDVLKGVNMAFRAAALKGLRLDTDLRGSGAQTCNDMALGLGVQKAGWRLLFDPAVAVDHFPAQRFDADQRGAPSPEAIENHCFNVYLTLRRHMRRGVRRRMALLWAWWVGTRSTPGFVRGWVARLKGNRAALETRAAAARAWVAAKGLGEARR